MVKTNYILLLCVILFSACRPDERVESISLQGVLIAGESLEVQVALVQDFQSLPMDGAQVTCRLPDGSSVQLEQDGQEPTRWFSDDIVIISGATYQIEVGTSSHHASAETTVPNEIELVQVSATVIPINENSLGQPIFTVLWASAANVSHVLTLQEPIEGLTIPFSVPSGNFNVQYSLPVPGQGTTLFDTDFKFYGEHTLTIYAIDRDYEEVFFYRPAEGGNRLTMGPSNVEGGTGYLTSASQTDVVIEIVE